LFLVGTHPFIFDKYCPFFGSGALLPGSHTNFTLGGVVTTPGRVGGRPCAQETTNDSQIVWMSGNEIVMDSSTGIAGFDPITDCVMMIYFSSILKLVISAYEVMDQFY
jgi:hypothetical protein